MTKNVLIGVCGIGLGHTMRQLPIIKSLIANDVNLSIFTFGEGLKYFSSNFPDIDVYDVFVPFVECDKDGIMFDAVSANKVNHTDDFFVKNYRAMSDVVKKFKGNFDYIISDYEPISAQLSYALDVDLITIDQQSKYFVGKDFPTLKGRGYKEEYGRLGSFFPKAKNRYACSFFKVNKDENSRFDVKIIPPFIREDIENIKIIREKSKKNGTLVYFSSYMPMEQSEGDILEVLGRVNQKFSIFKSTPIQKILPSNVEVFNTGSPIFLDKLSTCESVIATSGHSLTSELMYLEMPTYSCPLDNYEQNYNAHILDTNQFGISCSRVEEYKLNAFLKNSEAYKANIENDVEILNKNSGLSIILKELGLCR